MQMWRSKQRREGQSLVEMAFILPLLLVLFFGIIDIGYFLYGYATVYRAARRGADVAAIYPPFSHRLETVGIPDVPGPEGSYDTRDMCVQEIVNSVQKGSILIQLQDVAEDREKFSIIYLENPTGPPIPDSRERAIGDTVSVAITYTIEPLTPMMTLIPGVGKSGITVHASSMRTIQGEGESLPIEGMDDVCEEDDPHCRERVICR